MKRTLIDRALDAAERFADRQHEKPRVVHGKRWPTPARFAATLAFAAGWKAGYEAAKADGRRER